AAHRLGGAVVVAGLVDLCVGVVVVVGLGLRRSVAMAGLVDVGLLALVLLGLRRPVVVAGLVNVGLAVVGIVRLRLLGAVAVAGLVDLSDQVAHREESGPVLGLDRGVVVPALVDGRDVEAAA